MVVFVSSAGVVRCGDTPGGRGGGTFLSSSSSVLFLAGIVPSFGSVVAIKNEDKDDVVVAPTAGEPLDIEEGGKEVVVVVVAGTT